MIKRSDFVDFFTRSLLKEKARYSGIESVIDEVSFILGIVLTWEQKNKIREIFSEKIGI